MSSIEFRTYTDYRTYADTRRQEVLADQAADSANIARRLKANAIAYAFVEAARAFPGDMAVLRSAAEGVLKGRFAIRSRWIAAAALREVYGAAAMHFLLKGWNDERSMGRVLSGQRRQGWWDADLEKRLVAALRFRFGG